MIELIFIACLAGTATERCLEQSLLFQDVPLQLCALRGQAALADWAGRHPDWRIEEWHCHVAGTRAQAV